MRKAIKLAATVGLVLFAVPAGSTQSPAPPRDRSKPSIATSGMLPAACQYPMWGFREHATACCKMKVEVLADSSVSSVTGKCSDPRFEKPTAECLRVLKWLPALKNGKPVRATLAYTQVWRLESVGKPATSDPCDGAHVS